MNLWQVEHFFPQFGVLVNCKVPQNGEKSVQLVRGKKCIFCVFRLVLSLQHPHNHMGWATSMPFASINTTHPRNNKWNFGEKKLRLVAFENLSYFESTILIFGFVLFRFIPMKISQSLLVSRDGSKFWSIHESSRWRHFLTCAKHFDGECTLQNCLYSWLFSTNPLPCLYTYRSSSMYRKDNIGQIGNCKCLQCTHMHVMLLYGTSWPRFIHDQRKGR